MLSKKLPAMLPAGMRTRHSGTDVYTNGREGRSSSDLTRPARGDIIFCAGFDSSTTWTMTVATSQGETAGLRGGEELIEAGSGLENSF